MSSNFLVSGGTAEWHLIVHLFPALKPKLKYPEGNAIAALSDDTVRERLSFAIKSKIERICVLFDAEQREAQRSWRSVREVLAEDGYAQLPEEMPKSGVICEAEGRPRVGVWIMPDNLSRGMIEDFYLQSIPRDDRERIRSEQFIQSIPSSERLFGAKISKAVYGVWLSIQKEPTSPAQAITRNLVSRESGQLPLFVSWLQRLFAEELA